MKGTALVTGASSGIGREIALELNRRGYDLIIVARREERLQELKAQLKGSTRVVVADLRKKSECMNLYMRFKDAGVSVLVNNAGFGDVGRFVNTDLDKELDMISVNCVALHMLTKLFLKDFCKRNYGYILNVASSAGLMAGGPFMSTYYATKAYAVNLTAGINQELKFKRSKVVVSALCPGPVDTEFNDVAGVTFGIGSITPQVCAKSGVDGLFARKMIIVPEPMLKIGTVASRFLPKRLVLTISGFIQKKKISR